MLKIFRIVTAFLCAPLAGLFLIRPFALTPYRLWIDGQFVYGIEFMWVGLIPVAILYILVLIASVPVFLLIRHWKGWTLISCLFAAAITSLLVMSWILFIGTEMTPSANPFSGVLFIIGALLGTPVYGLAFWFIVREKKYPIPSLTDSHN